jgi:hypothetical protein
VLSLFVASLFVFMVGTVYLSVLQVRLGESIRSLRSAAQELGGEVRELEGRKATLTSLASIRRVAVDMGMVYPREAPRTLNVLVPEGRTPPTWLEREPGLSSPAVHNRPVATMSVGLGGTP